jgi:hypothetical protein
LDMLILMNDKQAAELESILGATIAGSPPPPAKIPANLPIPGAPHLSHIANLPGAASNPKTSTVKPIHAASLHTTAQYKQWQKDLQMKLEEKELAAPPPKPVAAKRPDIKTEPKEARAVVPTMDMVSPKSEAAAKIELESLADVEKLTLSHMRGMNPADLLIRLQQLSKMEGYFNLLSFLESSPLYLTYINSGKKMLGGTAVNPGSDLMSKAEFEVFADILRKIQIN